MLSNVFQLELARLMEYFPQENRYAKNETLTNIKASNTKPESEK